MALFFEMGSRKSNIFEGKLNLVLDMFVIIFLDRFLIIGVLLFYLVIILFRKWEGYY